MAHELWRMRYWRIRWWRIGTSNDEFKWQQRHGRELRVRFRHENGNSDTGEEGRRGRGSVDRDGEKKRERRAVRREGARCETGRAVYEEKRWAGLIGDAKHRVSKR